MESPTSQGNLLMNLLKISKILVLPLGLSGIMHKSTRDGSPWINTRKLLLKVKNWLLCPASHGGWVNWPRKWLDVVEGTKLPV